MARQYARFDNATIGSGLVATDGGLVITTTLNSTSRSRMARSTFSLDGVGYGAEFVFWGDATSLLASVGLVLAATGLNAEVGVAAGSVGWRLDSGEIRLSGTVVTSGLSPVGKGQIVGVQFVESPGFAYSVRFSVDGTNVAEITLPSKQWHFAVSLASATAGQLSAAVNAGQWPARGAAAAAGWQAALAPVLTQFYADRHWLSATTDNPANTRYEGAIVDEGLEELQRVGFWPWADAVSPRPTGGQVRIHDPDGRLIGLDASQASVLVKTVDRDGTLASATTVSRFMVDTIEVLDDGYVRLRLRDPHDALDEPLNAAVFLPYVPALAWKAQPVVIGACASVPLLAANSDGSVGFLADSALGHVDLVMDRGDPLESGTWSLTSDGQQLFLDSPPLGPVLADVTTIAGSSMTPATLSQTLHRIFSRVGFAAWSKTDTDAIDTATGYAGVGVYIGSEARSARQVRDQVLGWYCASTWQSATGVMRTVRLIAPEAVAAVSELQAAQLDSDLVWAYDQAPNLSRRMGYRPNAQTMGSADFVTDVVDVPMSRRAELMQAFRGVVYSAVALHARYDAADRRDPVPSGFWRREDAQAEIDRVCGLYAVERRFYTWTGRLTTGLPAIGDVVTVYYPAYGMDAGRKLLVVALQPNRATGRVMIRFWGA